MFPKWALRAGFIFGLINFTVFFIIAAGIGGDAINGHAESGHFFLSNHGRLTEVSHSVFLYSQCHVLSQAVTWPITMICAYLLYRDKSEISN